VGAVEAAVSDAVGSTAASCAGIACGAGTSTAGGLGCSAAISWSDGPFVALSDNNQLSCGAQFAIICLAVPP
jgi:hypothetical protein